MQKWRVNLQGIIETVNIFIFYFFIGFGKIFNKIECELSVILWVNSLIVELKMRFTNRSYMTAQTGSQLTHIIIT